MRNLWKQIATLFSLLLITCSVGFTLTACGNEPTKSVKELTIIQPPEKTTYLQGERFDSTGLIINALYEDDTIGENIKYTIIPDRALRLTDTYVAAKYGDKQVSIKITVLVRGNQSQYSIANTPVLENSPLKDKTYLFLGSSVTLGSASGQESMADFIAKRNDCTSIKRAASGTLLADLKSNSYVKRLEKYMDSDEKVDNLDAFICQLSTNDAQNPQSFGTVTSDNVKDKSLFDKSTTFGAIEYIIATVKETWNCPIMFYTNSHYDNSNYATMITELKNIAQKWNIRILDLFNDEEFNQISSTKRELYMYDDIHPTKAGYRDWWVPKFEDILKTL